LLTRIDGPGAGPSAAVVAGDGRSWGQLNRTTPIPGLVAEATRLLASGHGATRRVEDPEGTVLVEAWVPAPRVVVIGAGELTGAISTQATLLGWDTRATEERDGAGPLLDWAGSSAALVVLSHDPHLDTPALALGLERGVPYVGALGSRKTQSRRLERLRAEGVDEAQLERIHRPIGLDLGARSGAEVALAICAEILASHCGRDARPLRETTGPIHDRPAAATV
jgi:xanthine dehydrogenase accessory factor